MKTVLGFIVATLALGAHAAAFDDYHCDLKTGACEHRMVERTGILTAEQAAAKDAQDKAAADAKRAERATLKAKLQGWAKAPPTRPQDVTEALQEMAKQLDQLLPDEPAQ